MPGTVGLRGSRPGRRTVLTGLLSAETGNSESSHRTSGDSGPSLHGPSLPLVELSSDEDRQGVSLALPARGSRQQPGGDQCITTVSTPPLSPHERGPGAGWGVSTRPRDAGPPVTTQSLLVGHPVCESTPHAHSGTQRAACESRGLAPCPAILSPLQRFAGLLKHHPGSACHAEAAPVPSSMCRFQARRSPDSRRASLAPPRSWVKEGYWLAKEVSEPSPRWTRVRGSALPATLAWPPVPPSDGIASWARRSVSLH